jgi:arylsulfatase A
MKSSYPWRWSYLILVFLTTFNGRISSAVDSSSSQPNIIVILADDLGFGDLSCNNPQSKITTPHLDQLAKGGLRFTDAHTPSSVCTPTRYGLLTGQYCWRTRLKSSVLDGFSPPLIASDRLTLASMLKQAGYTTACIGKWHLGMQWTKSDGRLESSDRGEKGFRSGTDIDFKARVTGGPLAVGFDSYFGISASLDMPPYCWIENDRCQPLPNTSVTGFHGELFRSQSDGVAHTDFKIDDVLKTLKDRTLQTIDQHFNQANTKPLFMYLPLNSPHLPVAPSSAFLGKSQVGLYGDFVLETDDFVGGVVEALQRHQALANTLIIVTSDNGGLWHSWEAKEADDVKAYKPTPRAKNTASYDHRSNGMLRGTKADIYEGGHRVPFLVHWPQQIPAGRDEATPVELTDVMATLADVIGYQLPPDLDHDSCSFATLLGVKGRNTPLRSTLIHHSAQGVFAIRRAGWKYVESRGSGGFSTPKTVKVASGEAMGQLYHLDEDPFETRNLFLQEPQRVRELSNELEKIRNAPGLH